MIKRNLTSRSLMLAALVALVGCGDEEMGPAEGHTPADVALFVVGGAELTPDVTLAAGETVRIEARFLAHDGDVITGIEGGHFASFTFTPATLATVTEVAGRTFAFDVTAQATAGAGSVTVGYGHDEEADELSFGPFTVTVQ